MWIRWLIVMVVAAGMSGVGGIAADDEPPKSAAVAKPELPPYTPEREEAALRFVAEHHPELAEVLGRLKTLARDQYEQAIREIFQSTERLALVQGHDKDLYELLLEAWKVNSRIEVLAARLTSAKEKDAEREAELKGLLFRQVDLQQLQIEHNRRRLLATLEGMDANLKWLKENREQLVERRLGNLTRVRQKATAKQPQQPAGTAGSKKD